MSDWETEVQRIVRRHLAAEPERIASLLAEVEAEAWQEVRALLRRAMVEALLEEVGRGDLEEQGETRAALETGVSEKKEASSGQEATASPSRCHVERSETSPPVPAPQTGFYVYGIVDCSDLAEMPARGVADGRPVTLQPYRDLAAVVSAVPLDQFGEEALKANLADMARLEARVRAHQTALDAVLPQATLVPMKFATIYFSPAGVEEFLATRYDELMALFDHLRGRREWGLKLYCDEARLAAQIAEISPEVQRLRAEIESKPKGAAYLLARKLQETSQQEIERIGLEVADQTHVALAELSAAACLNPLQGPEITGRAERMLLNGAYLVDDALLEAFRAALGESSARYGDHGFTFEMSGPWPAYNFVTLRDHAPGAADG